MNCSSCGSPKEKDERYTSSAPDPSRAVTDPSLLAHAARGPNWECPHCGGHERDGKGECRSCGGLRREREEERDHKQTSGRIERPTSAPSCRKETTEHSSWARKSLPLMAIIGVGIVGIISLLLWIFLPHKIEAQITSLHWEYTSDLRQKTLMHGEGWGNRTSFRYSTTSKPDGYGPRSDSFHVICEGRKYGTENCDPYDCNPHEVSYDCNCRSYECNCTTHQSCSDNENGFSDCEEVETCSTCQECETCSRTEYDTCYHQCDVIKDWCTYDYYEWPIIATEITNGSDHEVFWPKLAAEGTDQRLDRKEDYAVTFRKKEKTWAHKPKSLQEFQMFERGANWTVKVNRAGQIWPIAPATDSL
jgi:hypothetical protein